MSNAVNTSATARLIDEYGNIHYPSEELARGGQGVVFRTKDADLAIKQPIVASVEIDMNANLRERFCNIRLLPLPSKIKISMPLAILRDQPGYVMRLLNGMRPFESFEMNGTEKNKLIEGIANGSVTLPQWLAQISNEKFKLMLLYYVRTGSTKRRLCALYKCACILARLHNAGLVYGDISPKNVFIGEGDSPDVWLIDADNLRFEMSEGGNAVYTSPYGAPEIVQGRDQSRPRTDCWAFAVLAFQSLALIYPFKGDEGGWDADPPPAGQAPADADEQAYAGYLPFIDDETDDSNAAIAGSGLSRELVTTPPLRRLFQETFGAGRTEPHRRPAMAFWALELAKAFDHSLVCPDCAMSYFADEHTKCPYCRVARPIFARIRTPRWEICVPAGTTEVALPRRLFYPFSFEHCDDVEYEANINWDKKIATPLRGTKPFPSDMSIEFVEASV